MKKLIALFIPFLLASPVLADEPAAFIAQPPKDMTYLDVPGMDGLRAAVLYGNPEQEGLYVIRVVFPAGMRSPPHFHDQDRYITVIEGVWHFGTDQSGGCEGAKALPAGSFGFHPAGAVHYDGSCGAPVTVQIMGEGPVKTTWLGGADSSTE
ncbi:MAG: cupin domain-containing protein [Alphaproteobacteria bacterium]|nr:cupin domain-containing protein [Alphaproteobacteria bacterium]